MTTVTTTMRRFPRIAGQLLHALIAAGITILLCYLLMHTWSTPTPAPTHPRATVSSAPTPAAAATTRAVSSALAIGLNPIRSAPGL